MVRGDRSRDLVASRLALGVPDTTCQMTACEQTDFGSENASAHLFVGYMNILIILPRSVLRRSVLNCSSLLGSSPFGAPGISAFLGALVFLFCFTFIFR